MRSVDAEYPKLIIIYLFLLVKQIEMAPKYKLTYFDISGLGEPIRFLFSYGGIEFVDNRIARADWPALKNTTPLGQMPVLEVDGKTLHQSVAITRYVAKQVGLAGKNDLEDYAIDAIIDTISDFRIAFTAYRLETNPETKVALKRKVEKEKVPRIFRKLDGWAKENNGYLANGRLTWADLYFVALLGNLAFFERDFIDGYFNLEIVRKNVLSIPRIKTWVENRPKDVWE